MAVSAAGKAPGFLAQLRQGYKRFMFRTSDYRKYGLLRDDFLIEREPVEEALRRLPQTIKDERTYRILRAVQCSIRHEYLPEEQWTTYEQDVFYLVPYIEEVEREIKEKQEWNSK